MKKYLLLLFSLLLHGILFSGDLSIDSLEQELKNARHENTKVKILCEIGNECVYTDKERAKKAIQEAEKITRISKNKSQIAQVLLLKGRVQESEGKYKEALSNYIEANRNFEEENDLKGMGQTLNNMGIVHWYMLDYDKAVSYFQEGYKINKKAGNKQAMSTSLGNMGIIYDEQGKYEEALKIYEEALEIFIELKDEWSVSACYNNIGLNYSATKKFAEAETYFKKSLEINRQLNDVPGIATALNNLGYNKVRTKKFAEALPYLNESLTVSKENGLMYDQKLALLNLSLAYDGLGQHKKAFDLHRQYAAVKDSLLNIENSKELQELEIKYSTEKKTLEIKNLRKEKQITHLELERERKDRELSELREAEKETKNRIYTTIFISIIILVLVTAGFIFWRYQQKKADNLILHSKNEEISTQKNIIEEKNKDITDSIQYAKTIQDSVLPDVKELNNYFSDSFVLFMPRDIVSGDFYWFTEVDDKIIFTVGDCTGHGVPGSLMSMMGINLIHQIVREDKITDPAKILHRLDENIRKRFAKENAVRQTNDGMDIAIGVFYKKKNIFAYASAMRPVYFVRNGELMELKNDVFPIGGNYPDKIFKTRDVEIQKGDSIYFSTDGYADQFGGEKGKKFLTKKLKMLIQENASSNMNLQQDKLLKEFVAWKGKQEQVDDVCVMGIRI